MSLPSSIFRGAVAFAIVSIAGFAVWAFGAKWFQTHGGEGVMYACCAAVFVVLSGALMHPLVNGAGSLARFYKTFMPAFLAYAAVWCVVWFQTRDEPGEWIASAAGSLAFAAVLSLMFKNTRALLPAALVIFIGHSAGYFLGGIYYYAAHTVISRLLWGLIYGLGFGAGIGFAYHAMQRRK